MGLFTLSPLIVPPAPSLLFGGAATDVVNVGSGSSLDDLDPFTYLLWLNPTTLTANRVLFRKIQTGVKILQLSNGTGDLQLAVSRSGVATNYTTNSTPLAATGTWIFLAATYNSAASAGQVHNIYKGSLTDPATECTYSTATDGSGASTTDATGDQSIGGRIGASSAFQGAIASAAILNRELTLADVRMFQRWMLEWSQSPVIYPGLVAAYAFGVNGTKVQRDLTGNKNDGTVTGSTVTRGIVRPPRQRIAYIPTDLPGGAAFQSAWAVGSNVVLSGAVHA